MSAILLCATPVHGHVTPVLAVARHLVEAGHDVRVLTGARFADEVARTGAEFVALPAEADFDDRDLNIAFPGRVGRTGLDGIRWDVTHIFLTPALAQLRAVDAEHARRHVDIVIAENMFVGAGLLCSRTDAERPRVIALGIVPLGLPAPHLAPYGLGLPPKAGFLGRLRNALLTAFTTKVVFRPVVAEFSATLRDAGLDAASRAPLTWADQADAIAQCTVPSFEYPLDAPTLSFIGPVSRTRRTEHALPEWWDDLAAARAVVHVTQGTIANADTSELIDPTIEALADEDVLVVVTTGGQAAPDRELPANVRIADFLPYDMLLPLVDVYVTNGGYGGVHYALEHGIPIVASGRTEDKAEVGARVAWSGAGINLKAHRPSPSAVKRAVTAAMTDPSYREASAAIGAQIRAADSLTALDEVITAVELVR